MKRLLFITCIIGFTFSSNAQCDSTLPITENFNDSNVVDVCWNVIDGDGDNNNWMWQQYSAYYGGHKVVSSYSYYTSTGALTPDNWIISHAIDLTSFNTSEDIELSWKVRAELNYVSHEYYTVYAATGSQISDFESSSVKRGEYVDEIGGAGVFVTRTLDVSALVGNMIYIAFRHHNSTNQSNINIDDVSVSAGSLSEECISDTDNDGVCDAEDQCPGQNDSLIGTSCNDGDPCTINDVYDTNCGCSGTFADTDNDGVCDVYDECPGFDDTIDTDGNGIPDGCETTSCEANTTNFINNPLTHTGSGSNMTTLTFPTDSQDVVFTISGINQKLKGKASSKYIERVDVTYLDESGVSNTYGSYSGDNVGSAVVDIQGKVHSVSVRLTDIYDGSTSSNMTINFSEVTFCGNSIPCDLDSDGDGVCDADDICPGFDDTIDANGNGIPDGCESASCTEIIDNFTNNALTHTGSGANNTIITFLANGQDVAFTISGINQKLKGKESNKYIERVDVTYIDESGVSNTYGTYSGGNVSSAVVDIHGKVHSVTVSLIDTYDGNTSSNMSINFSDVTYCVDSSTQADSMADSSQIGKDIEQSIEDKKRSIKIYPNPASHTLFIKGGELENTQVNITLYNINGALVRNVSLNGQNNQAPKIDLNGLAEGLYLLRMVNQKGAVLITQRIVVRSN